MHCNTSFMRWSRVGCNVLIGFAAKAKAEIDQLSTQLRKAIQEVSYLEELRNQGNCSGTEHEWWQL